MEGQVCRLVVKSREEERKKEMKRDKMRRRAGQGTEIRLRERTNVVKGKFLNPEEESDQSSTHVDADAAQMHAKCVLGRRAASLL